MILLDGGIDAFYIDESHNTKIHVITAVAIPMLRQDDTGIWKIVWRDHFDAAKAWRRRVQANLKIPMDKELHSSKLASGSGHFLYGSQNFSKPRARGVFAKILGSIDFIPPASVMSVATNRGSAMYGQTKLEAAMHALLQRMRTQCESRKCNAMAFFDQGHAEYRSLYRKSQIYLQTGSSRGQWQDGRATQNKPLSMFFEDGNEKNSKFCFFTQVADLIAFAAFMKAMSEVGELTDWQKDLNYGGLYDDIPRSIINTRVQNKGPRDGVVRLWL